MHDTACNIRQTWSFKKTRDIIYIYMYIKYLISKKNTLCGELFKLTPNTKQIIKYSVFSELVLEEEHFPVNSVY